MSSIRKTDIESGSLYAALALLRANVGGDWSIRTTWCVSRFVTRIEPVSPDETPHASQGQAMAGMPADVASVEILPVARSASRTTALARSAGALPTGAIA
jgi:hypothetical protein